MSNSRAGNGAPSGQVSPQEIAQIRRSATSKEQAPSTRVQAAIFENWREAADRLGSPFEVEKIPISKLRAMRRDPMLGFGLAFIKTPHVRAKWFINAKSKKGPNAQIAAHLDHDLRKIYADFVLQYLNCLEFGFQAIGKRFELSVPAAFYIEVNANTGEETEKPVWDQGGIQPVGWKPFVALPPEGVEPIWAGDDFNGIDYTTARRGGDSGGGTAKTYKLDLYHSLWVTNERAQNFSSIWGYPRLGYAYRYWWSYWFRWAIADRAFERKADPSVKVHHPEGSFVNEANGQITDYGEYALELGERMRSGGVLAMPSEVYEGPNGPGTVRQWDIDFTKDAVNFEPFDKSFEYLDVQKLRSLFIPEQAFLEGRGGTSSRNVAAELGQSFVESQAVLSSQISDHLNRFVIPQWVAVNYPEFIGDGGAAEIKIQGFADQDVEFTRQLIQLIGQQESGVQELLKLADIKRLLEDAGTPIADFQAQQRRQEQIAQQARLQGPPNVAPVPGQQVGITQGVTGFQAYRNPPDRIVVTLADNSADFLENLPDSPHFSDKTVRSYARRLWNIWHEVYADETKIAVETIRNNGELPDDVELALKDYIERANDLLKKWKFSDRWGDALTDTRTVFRNLINRASLLEQRKARKIAKMSDEERDQWIEDHLAEFAAQVAATSRTEIRDFVAKRMEEMDAEGQIDTDRLATEVAEHFADFPKWKSDRLARTEVSRVYNAATLLGAKAAKIDKVQALDARKGPTDADCENRDGKVFDVADAWNEIDHPNGTLAWRMVPAELSIQRGYEEDGAYFDDHQNVLHLSDGLADEAERAILKSVVDHMVVT